MKINKKGILKYTVWVFLIFLCLFNVHRCAQVDSCLDLAGVWDYTENKCRKDCIVWNKYYGCVEMNEAQMAIFYDCAENSQTCDQEKLDNMFEELCKYYNAPQDPITGSCNFSEPPIQK